MATFRDDFERANGAPGSPWNVSGAGVVIDSGSLIGTGFWKAWVTSPTDPHRREAGGTFFWQSENSEQSFVCVCVDSAGSYGYHANVWLDSTTYKFRITRGTTASPTTLAEVSLGTVAPVVYSMQVIWEDGALTARLNGGNTLTASDATYAGNTNSGIQGYIAHTRCASFYAVGGSAVEFTVGPAIIGNYGACTTVTFGGTNTNWSAGTPGSPVFTVDHGTLSDQTITSETAATATYCPGDYLGAATFTDPSTGQTAVAMVTSDPGTVPPTGTGLISEWGAAILNRTGEADHTGLLPSDYHPYVSTNTSVTLQTLLGDLILANDTSIGPTPAEGGQSGALYEIWRILNGGYAHSEEVTIQDQAINAAVRAQSILDELARFLVPSTYTLQDVMDNLRGTGAPTHADILTAIGGIDGADLQPVLDAIAALRGDDHSTVASILAHMVLLRTASNLSLQDVLDAIAGIDPGSVNLQPVLDAISDLSGQLTTAETNIFNEIAGLGIVLSALQLTVGNIDTTVGGLVDSVSDILEILNNLPQPETVTVPLWPGLDNVTLGASHALTDGLHLDGPMHGVLVAITGTPPNAGAYLFDEVHSWTHAGAIMFGADNLYYERPESIGIDQHVLVPRTMAEPATAILRINKGFTGTVRTWLRSA
jgi:hypothetical protein